MRAQIKYRKILLTASGRIGPVRPIHIYCHSHRRLKICSYIVTYHVYHIIYHISCHIYIIMYHILSYHHISYRHVSYHISSYSPCSKFGLYFCTYQLYCIFNPDAAVCVPVAKQNSGQTDYSTVTHATTNLPLYESSAPTDVQESRCCSSTRS